jgi:Transposase DDE domain group 1
VGERQNGPFQLSFNPSLKVDFQGTRVTSDGGLTLVRELDERLGFGELIQEHLRDCRRGKNRQFLLGLPSVPVERGAAAAERDCLQSGESVAAVAATEENRQVVAHQLAAAACDARPLLYY